MGTERFFAVPNKPRDIIGLAIGALFAGVFAGLIVHRFVFSQTMVMETLEPPPTPVATTQRAGLIPLERGSGHLIVRATANNSITGRFLVDTGATNTLITTQFAKKLGLDPRNDLWGDLVSLIGKSRARVVRIHSLRVGTFGVANIFVHVIEIPWDVDGIIGLDFLGHYRFDINPDTMLLGLKPAKIPLGTQLD